MLNKKKTKNSIYFSSPHLRLVLHYFVCSGDGIGPLRLRTPVLDDLCHTIPVLLSIATIFMRLLGAPVVINRHSRHSKHSRHNRHSTGIVMIT